MRKLSRPRARGPSPASCGAREQQDEVGVEGVAAPALLARDDVLVAVAGGAALDVREVGAGAGLGEGGRADPVAAGAAAEELGAARGVADVRAHAVAAGDDAGDAHPGARKLFGDEGVLEDAAAHAAPLAADHDAEVAHLADALEERVGDVRLLLVELVREREDFVEREAAGVRLDGEAVFGEVGAGHSCLCASLHGEVRALVVDHEIAALVEAFGVPGDDPEGGTRFGLAGGDDAAARGEGVAGVDGAVEGQLVDAEKRAAGLAQVFDAEADDGAEDEERVDDDVRVAVGAGVLGVEVEGVVGEGGRREERVVAFVQGAAPVVLEGAAGLEVLEGVAVGDQCGTASGRNRSSGNGPIGKCGGHNDAHRRDWRCHRGAFGRKRAERCHRATSARRLVRGSDHIVSECALTRSLVDDSVPERRTRRLAQPERSASIACAVVDQRARDQPVEVRRGRGFRWRRCRAGGRASFR